MRFLSYLFISALLVSVWSCRDDFEFETFSQNLEFSRDTVYLDTVFTNIGSSTYTLKVYNRSDKNILIPSLKLGKGEASKFRLMVDGMPGKVFSNVELLAKDSMFVFIETTIDYEEFANPESSYLYTDIIEFNSESKQQKVDLVTLVQDAYFLYPRRDDQGVYEELILGEDRIRGFYLDENDPKNGNEYIWNNTKPYVIYGYGAVPSGKTLEIEAGAKIHFHDNSGLIVMQNGSVQANGSLEQPIMIEGDRLEPSFAEVPGQWGTIWLTSGSVNNSFKHTTIKNSTIGLYVQNCPLELENVQIYNSSNFGIMATTGFINAFNTAINNAGQSSLVCSIGGSYNFKHSTIANYWNRGHRSLPALVLDNTYETVDGILPLHAHFENCIIFGTNSIEVNINKAENSVFEYSFSHSLLKFIDSNNRFINNPLYDFDNPMLFNNSIIARTSISNKVDFVSPIQNDLRILESSAAKGTANSNYSGTTDLLGNTRSGAIDMGAFNFTTID